MKKFLGHGYTLAEALIAMTLIGVVAAMTIPKIFVGFENKMIAANTSKAVNQFETGCQMYMQNYNSENDVVTDKILLIPGMNSELLNYMGIVKIASNGNYQFRKGRAELNYNYLSVTSSNYEKPETAVIKVTIDGNGFGKKPNKNGRDRFVFNLTNACKMVPADTETKTFIKNGFKIK